MQDILTYVLVFAFIVLPLFVVSAWCIYILYLAYQNQSMLIAFPLP